MYLASSPCITAQGIALVREGYFHQKYRCSDSDYAKSDV
jgi:hypothetical protein